MHILLFAALALLQVKPLERQFRAGDVEQFRVELVTRSESQGQRAEKIGVKAYATPFSAFCEERLSWRSTRRVLSVDARGVAEVEETLAEFSPLAELPPNADADEKGKADAALRLALIEWSRSGKRILRYKESPRGDITGLASDAGPVLDDAPAVVTAWLRRASRPRAVLRGALGGEGARWSEPRSVELPPWRDAHGAETGEWLAGPYAQLSSVRFDNLHVMQQITAATPATAGIAAPGAARFHAESVSTVVGAGTPLHGGYGSLMQATRSAVREVSRTLEPVPGLSEPPRFRSTLSVEVRITHSEFPPK